MHKRTFTAAVIACAALLPAGGAFAHHSYAAFDRAKVVELTGTVQKWEWTNPHVWLTIAVKDKGKEQTWALEGMAPATLRARGWSRTMMKVGDKVTVSLNPRRDGTPGGAFAKVVVSGGGTFGGGENPAAKAPE